MTRALLRLAAGAIGAAILVQGAGLLIERAELGSTDQDAVAEVEAQLRAEVSASVDRLGRLAEQAASMREDVIAAPRDAAAVRRLFEALDVTLPDATAGTTGVTIYDRQANPTAWSGRVSEMSRSRIEGPAALGVDADPAGPRLVRVEPIPDRDRPTAPRSGTVVAEQLLGDGRATPASGSGFILSGLRVPVLIHLPGEAGSTAPFRFVIPSSGGGPLIEAEVSPTEIAAARARFRDWTHAAVYSIFAAALALLAVMWVDTRRTHTRAASFPAAIGFLVVLVAARALFWFAVSPFFASQSAATPIDLLVNGLLLVAIAWVLFDQTERRRVTAPRRPLLTSLDRHFLPAIPSYLLAGAFALVLLWEYERFLVGLVSQASLNLLHFSLHPLNDPARLALAFGLVLLHAGVIWTAALAIRLARTSWRASRRPVLTLAGAGAWTAGAGIAALLMRRASAPVPAAPLFVALMAVVVCAAAVDRLRPSARRASQAARLLALYAALVLPALALYPSVQAFSADAKEQLVAGTFAPVAQRQRDDLKRRLAQALDEIDALPNLAALVQIPQVSTPTTAQAFQVWSNTALARSRLTSAVELYDASGRLVSRFVNLPDYDVAPQFARGCNWEAFEEVSHLGSSERHVLRASRIICVRDRRVGSIVVRAALDYRTLPFIASQSPYVESVSLDTPPPTETAPGRDVEFAVYGWSRTPLYASGTAIWPLPDDVFDQMVTARRSVWSEITRGGQAFRVYFFNDRGGIYALGYPVITAVGHLVNLAELMILTAALYVLLLIGTTTIRLVTATHPASGPGILGQVRSSFYRKLFLAFVASAVVPVVILAIATRAYFATRFSAGVEQDAVKTATVAERLVEDYTTLQQRGASATAVLDDQIMSLVSRAIDEDVSLFEGPRLQATSERDLFASGLLSARTPSGAYRKIMLEHEPTFVGVENAATSRYLLAAAPVRAGGHEGLVTVPLTLRERESEQQIDELDRGVWAASVLFVLLGAGLGYWMAERIADPVNRLTRATRRIARGDLDARIPATSSDEFGRLVQDFNRMAADLKGQRAERERTQRLEAWADMARQVAHDIKNPLTPIQLSAEHAQRVNVDRGRPLSPILEECVSAILKQVHLLRQIASEFSSFAASPTPRPERTDVGALIEEVVGPYRAGLSGRVAIDVRAAPELPSVSLDRTLFARALTNVIENALHAMPSEGTLTITTSPDANASGADVAAHNGSGVVVQATDTGVGMDPEAQARIFEPYFSTKAAGTGLGLTIAKRNIELNGGTIEVSSRRGLGTTVTIRLPREHATESARG